MTIHSYEVRVRARAGNGKVGDWTGWLTATAHPQTAPGPSNITLRATATGVDISWTPPTGQYTDSIVEYGVYYWDLDANCAILLLAAFRGTSAHIDDLIPGNRHLIAIETWNAVRRPATRARQLTYGVYRTQLVSPRLPDELCLGGGLQGFRPTCKCQPLMLPRHISPGTQLQALVVRFDLSE